MFENIALSVEETMRRMSPCRRTVGDVYRAYAEKLRVPPMCRAVDQPKATVFGVVKAEDALPAVVRIARIVGRFAGSRFAATCALVDGAFILDNSSASVVIGLPGSFRPHAAATSSPSSLPVAVAIAAMMYDVVAFGVDDSGALVVGGVDERGQWEASALSPPTLRDDKIRRNLAELAKSLSRIASTNPPGEATVERIARAWRAVDVGDQIVVRNVADVAVIETRSRRAQRPDAVGVTLRAHNCGVRSPDEPFAVNRVALFSARSLERWFGDAQAAIFVGSGRRVGSGRCALTIAYAIDAKDAGGPSIVATHFRCADDVRRRAAAPNKTRREK